MKKFISGNEAFAEGVRLSRPHVISAYPITPQTTVVENLSSMVENGSLKAEFIHVESEHSALSCAIGASSVGARTFTATSSQGLLYMAECLVYAAGGRYPIVLMNANRATALPWNIYGDQRDSLALLDCGFIQAYAENAQEALDLALMAYRIAEDKAVSTPFMVNLDGFALTHTYETVEVPGADQADAFLPPFETENKMDLDKPKNLGFSAGPATNYLFKFKEHQGLNAARGVIEKAEAEFYDIFGRRYPGLTEAYKTEDADHVIVTLGTLAGLTRQVVDDLRAQGEKVGLLKLRYIRPFPAYEIAKALSHVKAAAILEKDISFGAEGTVFTNVNSALFEAGLKLQTANFIGGLGGQNVGPADIKTVFEALKEGASGVHFLGIKEPGPDFTGHAFRTAEE